MEAENNETTALEAYPANERIKAEILNLRALVNTSLAEYMMGTVKRKKGSHNRVSDAGIIKKWKAFQISVVLLFKLLRPHIFLKKDKIPKDVKELIPKIEHCFIDLNKAENKMAISYEDWIMFSVYLDSFIFKMGVGKIERDIEDDRTRSIVNES